VASQDALMSVPAGFN